MDFFKLLPLLSTIEPHLILSNITIMVFLPFLANLLNVSIRIPDYLDTIISWLY